MESPAFISKFVHKRRRISRGDCLRHVHRDWLAALIVAFLLLFLAGAWSYYFYSAIKSGEFYSTEIESAAEVTIVNRESLDTMIDYIDRKKIQYDGLKTSPPVVQDPSM